MLYLSRTVEFSAAHSYSVPAWSEEENLRVFALCSNSSGHGHDYKLEVMVKGLLNERSGIVVNTTEIKQIVKEFVEKELDGTFLNREHPYFQDHIPTTENLADYIWHSLENRFQGCELQRIRLHENHYLFSQKESGSLTQLTRKYHFCSAHRLHSHHLSPEENLKLFGKCNNPHGHGHNYFLDVTIEGEPDPVTGMIINLADLDEIVEREVLVKFDHKHLNLDTEEFKELNPTSEVVAMVIYQMLQSHLPKLHKIGLWETEKNYFEYCGPSELR
ncbi:6-carboxytetrahydropterin synthase [Paenibacillus alginolyticus]|uniref:6-carboxy-5,6,7,8-tetrahydropterin synthase n=1 Tax=Paenibacillus alginolyticus TaxID=59839 RepID=A0ABT4GP63_9BACL|nr:6-carboxytetrahydropterin synthase [Paenibacillus alginolyticus]MCY9666520.1 6-carboxytetrahydropterin synthase [Paenibacillus alginolyticus]MCY9697866.1 6-carboxytetrahydropterin synthase [Paenibacillus alginolyticus]MEC0147729.1 6-carboxytetrahydropterin synthase [Paenibacillus alginolyticus]